MLERSHHDLYPQIGSKPITNLLASRFGPNRFESNLRCFACIHMMAKLIEIGFKSICKSHVNWGIVTFLNIKTALPGKHHEYNHVIYIILYYNIYGIHRIKVEYCKSRNIRWDIISSFFMGKYLRELNLDFLVFLILFIHLIEIYKKNNK